MEIAQMKGGRSGSEETCNGPGKKGGWEAGGWGEVRCQVEEVEVAGLAEAVNVWNEQGQQ